jgi:replicative DNA helicase
MRNIESELCGFLLRDNATVAEALAIGVKPHHFDDELLGRVFEVVAAAWDRQEAADLAFVAMKLGREHFTRLSGIRTNAPLSVNFAPYAQALVDHSRMTELHRRLVDIGHSISSRKPMDPTDPILRALGDLLVFSRGDTPALKTSTIRDATGRALAETEQRITVAQAGKPPGIPSGIPKLDACIHGFKPGFVYVLGARTGVGKTTMATTMAVNAALAGKRVAFVTVEMSDTDIADKMLLRLACLSGDRYLSGIMNDDELNRLVRAGNELAELPIFITDVARANLNDLALEIMRLVRIEGAELIVVDYLQIFETGDGRNRPSREEAKLVSARFKSLARSLKVPLLVLSQLNRQAPEMGAPDLIHVAESDQIARDADVVMFIYHDDRDDTWLSVSKQRRGKKQTIRLRANLEHSVFHEAEQA